MRILFLYTLLIASCMTPSNTPTDANDRPRTNDAATVLYDFTEQGKGNWQVQDDVVMGGRSDSQLTMTDDDRARFSGRVSLENNGGFCSIRQLAEDDPYVVRNRSAFVLRLRGDGKPYNFRVRTPKGRHAYAYTFPTNTDTAGETIVIPFEEMAATFRGRSVNVPNYAGGDIVELQILIGNKREETFDLLIESIGVQ